MFCFHKFGEIKNGYQYCSKCGRAISVPCNHVWKIQSERRISDKVGVVGILYALCCNKCGEIEQRKVQL